MILKQDLNFSKVLNGEQTAIVEHIVHIVLLNIECTVLQQYRIMGQTDLIVRFRAIVRVGRMVEEYKVSHWILEHLSNDRVPPYLHMM